MRKVVLSVVACAMMAIVPATALAHGHHHKRHHSRVHHRTFGHDWSQSGSSGTSTSTSSDQNAGTVASFTGGVLTIALNNGQTVSADVTGDTEIECQSADMSSSTWSSHDHGGDNSGSGDNGGSGDDDQGQGDDDNNTSSAQSCDMNSLAPGTVVHEARMSVSGAGATWDKVELVTQSTGTSQSSGSSDS